MKKILRVCAFLLAYLCVFAILAYLVETLFLHTIYYYTMADLAVVFANVIMFSVFMFHRAKTRKAWIEAEAKRWLQFRLRELSNPMPSWRKQLHKRLVWLPSLIVLVSALFLPEIAGLLSHVWHGRTLALQRFRIKTPLTWVLETDERTYCWAFSSKGIGRAGIISYFRQEPPFSEMHFYAVPEPDTEFSHTEVYLRGSQVLSQRSIQIGDRALNCWDVIPPHPSYPPVDVNYAFADIGCETKPYDFWADFSGPRTDSSLFYHTLEKVTVTK